MNASKALLIMSVGISIGLAPAVTFAVQGLDARGNQKVNNALAKRWSEQGMEIETLKTKLREMAAREKVYFVVDTLEYLHKGGRIGGATRLIGSVLQIKPILTIEDGQVEPYDKVRTLKQAIAAIIDLDLEVCRNNPDGHLTISHCAAEEQAQRLKTHLEKELHLTDIPVFVVPPAIVVHAGPGVITTSCFSAPE